MKIYEKMIKNNNQGRHAAEPLLQLNWLVFGAPQKVFKGLELRVTGGFIFLCEFPWDDESIIYTLNFNWWASTLNIKWKIINKYLNDFITNLFIYIWALYPSFIYKTSIFTQFLFYLEYICSFWTSFINEYHRTYIQ